MGTRGLKAKADLAVVKLKANTLPKPNKGLTREQSAEWRSLVPELVDVSRPRWPLIEAYCKHTVALRHIGQLITDIAQDDEIVISNYDKLLKMQERESRILSSLAVRLGIAQSTSYERRKRNPTKKAPWQFEG